MKLNVNAKELLALHNMLYQRCRPARIAVDPNLMQVYNRIRACIISSLGGNEADQFNAWMSKEQGKISELKDKLNDVKDQQSELPKLAAVSPDDFMEGFEDVVEYPRKRPAQHMPKPGKHHGHKR